MSTPQPEMAPAELLHRIEILAARKQHHLHKSMLGAQPLTLTSALRVEANLERCPAKGEDPALPAPPPEQWPGLAATRGERPSPARASSPGFAELGAQVPKGRYATPSLTEGADWAFWEIDKGKPETRWEGYTFVSRILGGHDPQPKKGREAYAALKSIVDLGIAEASTNYGRLIGHCGYCPAELTKRDSRYNGRGAQCSANHGLPYVTAPEDWEDPREAS